MHIFYNNAQNYVFWASSMDILALLAGPLASHYTPTNKKLATLLDKTHYLCYIYVTIGTTGVHWSKFDSSIPKLCLQAEHTVQTPSKDTILQQ